MKYKVIVNPTSGRGTGERSIPHIKAYFESAGLTFDLVRTERPWHAAELAQQAAVDGYDVVVSAGGDGTANEVINGLMAAKESGSSAAAMGVLCVGRGNDFAFSMGIPTDLEAGFQTLIEDHRQVIDIGRVTGGLFPEGRYFGNGVGIGFDAVVGFEALKLKHLHGFTSYIVGALKTIFLYFKAPMVRVIQDGNEITLPALMVSIMNGIRLGGGFMMAPQGAPDDGVFDVTLVRQVSRPQMFALITRFMAGTQAEHEAVQTSRVIKLKATALNGVLPAHADGETLCVEGTELHVELLPQQIELINKPRG
ncbi:MAG: diacylglycerol kinase family lipid kinase [Anaerolineales bacterium]|nr:diacylglycerol kinase family lipid kinase [Anaerolineales bacterium]